MKAGVGGKGGRGMQGWPEVDLARLACSSGHHCAFQWCRGACCEKEV
jgi:hypothetical protein